MDVRVKGLVVSSKDYGEKDKLVTFLTLEYGKIVCKARGVKAQKSKLKMQVQPFCFADFELVKTGNNYTLTGGNIIDNFFEIVSNIEKFEYGASVLEVLDKISKENEDVSKSLVLGLKVLKNLCYSDLSEDLLYLYFMLNILKEEGFGLNTNGCSRCKLGFMGETFFDFESGEIVCGACKDLDCMIIPPAVFACIRFVNNTDEDGLKVLKLKPEYIKSAIMLIKKNFENKFMCRLKSLS